VVVNYTDTKALQHNYELRRPQLLDAWVSTYCTESVLFGSCLTCVACEASHPCILMQSIQADTDACASSVLRATGNANTPSLTPERLAREDNNVFAFCRS
jgi:hypothetical protein